MAVKNLEEAAKAYESVGFAAGLKLSLPLLGGVGREIKKRANITNTTASPWKAMMRPGLNGRSEASPE
jgi:hypothetical protein